MKRPADDGADGGHDGDNEWKSELTACVQEVSRHPSVAGVTGEVGLCLQFPAGGSEVDQVHIFKHKQLQLV